MKTYLAFRSIGMHQSEAIVCSSIHFRRKFNGNISKIDNIIWCELRIKYRNEWSNLIGRI